MRDLLSRGGFLGSPAQFAARDSRSLRRTCRKYLEFFMPVEGFAKVRGLKRVLDEEKKTMKSGRIAMLKVI